MSEAPKRIEIPLTVEHDGETVEVGRICYVRSDIAERENAKLRELVRWMYRIMDESCAVHHPFERRPINPDILYLVYDRMRELGVEVDG